MSCEKRKREEIDMENCKSAKIDFCTYSESLIVNTQFDDNVQLLCDLDQERMIFFSFFLLFNKSSKVKCNRVFCKLLL